MQGQISVGYYNSATTQTGASLKTTLYNIIKGRTAQSYTPGLWNAYYIDIKANAKVWNMYSNCDFTFGTAGNQDNGTQGTAECQKYNREHSFPKVGLATLLHLAQCCLLPISFMLFPAIKYVNGKRGNMPYGEVSSISARPFGNGTKIGTCTFPRFTGIVFEPIDDYKGDFARAYLYMATRYETDIATW
jgi:endonuclease I